MYIKITKIGYYSDVKGGRKYQTLGLCTCGHNFELPENKFPACPHCGSEYGNTYGYNCDYSDDRRLETNNKHAFVTMRKGTDGQIILCRELPDFSNSTMAHIVLKSKGEVTLSIKNGLRIEKVSIDGEEKSITKGNISKALSFTDISQIRDMTDAAFQDYITAMRWVCEVANSTSLATIMCKIYEYPVLSGLREMEPTVAPRFGTQYRFNIRVGIEEGNIQKYTANIKKAFGLSQDLVQLVLTRRIDIGVAQGLSAKLGPSTAAAVIQDAINVVPSSRDSSFLSLAMFLSTRTTAERKRLVTYLTEEVSIYQGIDKSDEAWMLLRDYIEMSKDMEVGYTLCPKSLKLYHDLAAKNHKLVLNDIERKKFVEAVNRPEYKALEWVSLDKKWAVIIPQTPDDLIREGKRQSHCVGSYTKYVIHNKLRICFLRKTEDLDKPVLTLTVTDKNVCSTYLGFSNREATAAEVEVLRQWTKARNVKLQ